MQIKAGNSVCYDGTYSCSGIAIGGTSTNDNFRNNIITALQSGSNGIYFDSSPFNNDTFCPVNTITVSDGFKTV